MALRFSKTKNIGPFRATVSKKRVRTSFGFFGLSFWSFDRPMVRLQLITTTTMK